MEEEIPMPISSLHKHVSSSSTIRFLGLLKQPNSDTNPFELDESEVVWSSSDSTNCDSPISDSLNSDSIVWNSSAFSTFSNSPPSNRWNSFRDGKFGLSAALSDDRSPLVRCKRALDPSVSVASAARTIPPVPGPRSGSSSEDFPGSLAPRKLHQSAPVNVPLWHAKESVGRGSSKFGVFDEDGDETADEMLPPHEIVARSHMTTFSVFEGVGRTLKGRDLRRVRNAVWQKTGFID